MTHKHDAQLGSKMEPAQRNRDHSGETIFLSFSSSNDIDTCSGGFLGHTAEHLLNNFAAAFQSEDNQSKFFKLLDFARESGKCQSSLPFVSSSGVSVQCKIHSACSDTINDNAVDVFIQVPESRKNSTYSPESYNSLFAEIGCYLWEINLNEVFTHVSSSVEAVLGYKNYELIGQPLKKINSQPEYERFNSFYTDLKLKPRSFGGVKKKVKRKDGIEIQVEISAEPVYDLKGELIGFKGISKSLQSEQSENRKLEEFQSRYHSIIADSHMWFWEVDAQKRFTYLSQSFTEVTFIPVDQVLGKSYEAFQGEIKTDFERVLNSALANFNSFHRENIELEIASGETINLSSSGAPFFHDNGEFAGYRGHNHCITNEVQTEKKLAESEERFKIIVESSNTWFWEVDADLNVTYLSANFNTITGFPLEDHLGKSVFNLLDEDERLRLTPLIADIKRKGTSFKNFVGTIKHADGRTLHIESSGIPIIVDSEFRGWQGSNRDITNEVHYRKAIEESETRFRHIVETSDAYFWEINLELEFTYLSGNFQSITGYHQDEAVGKSALFLYTQDDQKKIKSAYSNQVMKPEVLTGLRRKIVRKDGIEISMISSGVPVFQDGQLIAFRGHERDVTKEQNLKDELSSTLNHTQAIVSSLPDMIFILNEKGDFVDCKNPDPEEIGDVDAFVGKNIRDLYSPGRANIFLQMLKLALESRKLHILEYHIRNAAGGLNHYECRVIKIEGRDDQVVAVVRNVTKATEAMLALEDTMNKLHRSNEELEQFAYVASHDLQEPIRLVSSYVKLLKQSQTAQFGKKDTQYIEFIQESCQRMKILVIGLLEFSELKAKELKIDRIDIKSLFNPILLTFDKQIREKNALLNIGRMPQIMCDPVLISQVFANLISNALKFHEPNCPPNISISASLVGDKVEFIVKDEGLGISFEDRERIFSIFHRGQRTSHIKSTGIGLAVCRKIVNRHGGNIWISDDENPGTTIHFTIPDMGILN